MFQVFTPRQRITFEEYDHHFLDFIARFNGRKDLYFSVYQYDGDFNSPVIDKVFIDIDPDDEFDAFGDLVTLHEWLVSHHILHTMIFSGRGFHILIGTNKYYPGDLKNPPAAIRGYVNHIIDETGISPDMQVVGDLMRVRRIPNTVNMKTGLYAIPLTIDDLTSYDDICESATKPRGPLIFYGSERVDISEYDGAHTSRLPLSDAIINGVGEYSLDDAPPCVKAILKNPMAGYTERFIVITALRDLAYPLHDTIEILRRALSDEKFRHCVEEEGQVEYLYRRQDLLFPSCRTIMCLGYCVEGCYGHDIYW